MIVWDATDSVGGVSVVPAASCPVDLLPSSRAFAELRERLFSSYDPFELEFEICAARSLLCLIMVLGRARANTIWCSRQICAGSTAKLVEAPGGCRCGERRAPPNSRLVLTRIARRHVVGLPRGSELLR